jgi:hypothetical protein
MAVRIVIRLCFFAVFISGVGIFAQETKALGGNQRAENAACVKYRDNSRPSMSSLDASTAQALNQMRDEIDCLFAKQLETLNSLPPKLLSAADRDAISESLRAEFSQQLSDLRTDLEGQIEALRRERKQVSKSEAKDLR